MRDASWSHRLEYPSAELSEGLLRSDPIEQLQDWIDEAHRAGVLEPNAMCLATADIHGNPSSRMVLLRQLDARGLSFFTNYLSRKGKELEARPRASVCFWWGALSRQVRVEGEVGRVSESESDAYFASRPRESQLASAASPQSQIIGSRQELEGRIDGLAEAYPDGIPRPAIWGGYRLIPDRFEFWQGRPARLHDRLVFLKQRDGWEIVRLAP